MGRRCLFATPLALAGLPLDLFPTQLLLEWESTCVGYRCSIRSKAGLENSGGKRCF